MDGAVLYANRAFETLTGRDGVSRGEARIQQLLSPGGAIFFETQFAPSLILRGTLEEIAFEFLKTDGTRVPVFVNAVLRAESPGKRAHILLAVFGARQRRMYESELLRARRESEQVEEVVRRSSDAILRLSPEHVIQTWNRGAQQIFGYSAEEAIGQPLWLVMTEDNGGEVARALQKLRGGVEVLIERAGRKKSGDPVDLSISMTPHLEAPGILVGYSAILRDITARKASEKALLQTEKLASVGRLASSIAHEINNPLEAVTNILYILETTTTDEPTRELVKAAQEELTRVSHIATHTLRFHKQSSGRTEVDLEAVFGSVLALYRARLQNSGIRTRVDSGGHAALLCYEGELRQVLVNLVSNAFDAMRHGGQLVLRSRAARVGAERTQGVRITVADSGAGMDESVRQRLFEPFFSTKGIGGTGLGLWITKDLVAKNQGTIRIRSSMRAERSGTVVSMVFPLCPDEAREPVEA